MTGDPPVWLTGEAHVGRISDGHSLVLSVEPDQEKLWLLNNISIWIHTKPEPPFHTKYGHLYITLQEARSHMTPHTLPVRSYRPDNGHQWSKSLLLHAQHVGGDISKQGRFHEWPFQTSPACSELCSLRNGVWYLERHLQVSHGGGLKINILLKY